jgi:hypothetical protein
VRINTLTAETLCCNIALSTWCWQVRREKEWNPLRVLVRILIQYKVHPRDFTAGLLNLRKFSLKNTSLIMHNVFHNCLCNRCKISDKIFIQFKVQEFSRNQAPAPNSTCQKGDMKHVPYWESTVMESPFNFTVISTFLLGASELVYIFVMKQQLHLQY